MKTAEEWLNEVDYPNDEDGETVILSGKQIKAIQLDAWRQGMTDALRQEPNAIPRVALESINKWGENIRNERDNKQSI